MWTSHKSSSSDCMPKSTCPYFNYMQTNRVQLSNNKFMIDFESLKENDIFILEIISFTCSLLNANLSGYTGTHQFPFVKRDLRRFCDNLPNRQKQIAAWIYNEYRWFPPTSPFMGFLKQSPSTGFPKTIASLENHILAFSIRLHEIRFPQNEITYANNHCHHASN